MELASADRLLQPECLSMDVLRKLLLQRSVQPKDLPSDRGGLINLYNRLILPLPQRVYNTSTRLGRKLRQKSTSSDNERTKSPSKPIRTESYNRKDGLMTTNGRPELQQRDSAKSQAIKRQPPDEGAPEAKKRRDITWP